MTEHPFAPIYDKNSRILILGSFPSVKSREDSFYYAHPRNRFWPLLAALRHEAAPMSREEKRAFLLRHHIALWDVIKSCDIRGSGDSSIRNAIPQNPGRLLTEAPIDAIYCNGKTAWRLYQRFLLPRLGIPAVCLPSTSPANAAFSMEALEKAWLRINFHLDHTVSYHQCRLCPRNCRTDRFLHPGYCKSPAHIVAARAALHHWEEPCISGTRGSGTVFFSGCTLRCCYCQNYSISQENFGKAISAGRLSQIFLELQKQGAHNINLVTATHYLPDVLEALYAVKLELHIPVVYNCGGYETPETVRLLAPYVDIWLPDIKYADAALSAKYSDAPDYLRYAIPAVKAMIEAAGKPVFANGLMKSGVILRHMVLPGQRKDSIALLRIIRQELPADAFMLSLLRQFTPFYRCHEFPELNRRLTSFEYDSVLEEAIRLGLDRGFMQEKSSAREEYTPPFTLEGIDGPE